MPETTEDPLNAEMELFSRMRDPEWKTTHSMDDLSDTIDELVGLDAQMFNVVDLLIQRVIAAEARIAELEASRP